MTGGAAVGMAAVVGRGGNVAGTPVGTAVLILATVGNGVDAVMELQEAKRKQKSSAVNVNDVFVDFTMILPYVNKIIKKNQHARHD